MVILAGCQPGTGENNQGPVMDDNPPPASGDLLTQIQDDIFTPICAECHVGSQAPQGLRLENTDVSYEFLVNVTAVGNNSFQRVLPDDPDNSYLVLKVIGDPRAGARMPLGGTALSDENIQLIEAWIEQGALPAESSQAQTKVVGVTSVSDQGGKTTESSSGLQFEIKFSQPLNIESATKDNILLFQNTESTKFLLSQNNYQLKPITNRKIRLTITNQQLQDKSLSLVINHPSTSGLLDLKGRLLDGDNNQLEGGVYEIQL